jgi:hypothetical protein
MKHLNRQNIKLLNQSSPKLAIPHHIGPQIFADQTNFTKKEALGAIVSTERAQGD